MTGRAAGYLLKLARRRLPFSLGWRNTTILGLALGVNLVLIILLLQPHGTDSYQAPWRTLRLSGYALCVLLPILAVHAVDRLIYRRQGGWYLYNELLARSLLLIIIFSSCYLYSVLVINQIRPSWSDWGHFVLRYGLIYLPLLLPLAIFLRIRLAEKHPEPPPGAVRILTIRGRNRDEQVELAAADFVYAEARENYVEIVVRQDERLRRRLIRATLAEVQHQIPGALRVHRSYLVNPARVEALEGNARKRSLRLAGIDQSLPVSPGLDPATLE